MSRKFADMISTVLTSTGILILMAMAFDLFDTNDNVMLFVGVACFIIAGLVRSIARIQEKYKN